MKSRQQHNRKAFGQDNNRKDNQIQGQMKRVFKAFSKRPRTMKDVSIETNVMRSNICRYIAKWRKQNLIGIAHYGRCPITKSKGVGFYTTDPSLFIVQPSKTDAR